MIKFFHIIVFAVSSLNLYSQNSEFVNLIFKNKDQLELTVSAIVDNAAPLNKFYLLSKTSAWFPDRFNLPSDGVQKNNFYRLYIFYDKWIDSFFSTKEKNNLANQAKYSTIKVLDNSYENIQVIDSVFQVKSSYVYQITQPLYTLDSSYAIIDASVYFPIETDKNYEDSHEAQMVFIFRRQENKHWALIKKRTAILLD